MNTYVHQKTCAEVFPETIFITTQTGNNPNSLTHAWVNKLCHIHITEYNLAITKDEVLTHDTTQTNVENIMLHERTQSQWTPYWMIPLR